mgnify:CR=1 FL=1
MGHARAGKTAMTRAIGSRDDQIVEIPAEMAFVDGEELTITRDGDVVTIRPARRPSMAETVAKLRAMPVPDEIEVYVPTEFPDRENL